MRQGLRCLPLQPVSSYYIKNRFFEFPLGLGAGLVLYASPPVVPRQAVLRGHRVATERREPRAYGTGVSQGQAEDVKGREGRTVLAFVCEEPLLQSVQADSSGRAIAPHRQKPGGAFAPPGFFDAGRT